MKITVAVSGLAAIAQSAARLGAALPRRIQQRLPDPAIDPSPADGAPRQSSPGISRPRSDA
ncbi:MAG: hypothetical protein KGP27_04635 [Hyphomicrobiales bacterium]|nr:hypothetical protein [Hyphomicrobiales bacterium]